MPRPGLVASLLVLAPALLQAQPPAPSIVGPVLDWLEHRVVALHPGEGAACGEGLVCVPDEAGGVLVLAGAEAAGAEAAAPRAPAAQGVGWRTLAGLTTCWANQFTGACPRSPCRGTYNPARPLSDFTGRYGIPEDLRGAVDGCGFAQELRALMGSRAGTEWWWQQGPAHRAAWTGQATAEEISDISFTAQGRSLTAWPYALIPTISGSCAVSGLTAACQASVTRHADSVDGASWAWHVGRGGTPTMGQRVTLTFPRPGTYQVSAQARSLAGTDLAHLLTVVVQGDAPPPADRDRDGVPDASDRCPDVAGRPPHGCADSDSDGVLDPDDLCPQSPGPPPRGCPPGPTEPPIRRVPAGEIRDWLRLKACIEGAPPEIRFGCAGAALLPDALLEELFHSGRLWLRQVGQLEPGPNPGPAPEPPAPPPP
jgi:hypothetical protein